MADIIIFMMAIDMDTIRETLDPQEVIVPVLPELPVREIQTLLLMEIELMQLVTQIKVRDPVAIPEVTEQPVVTPQMGTWTAIAVEVPTQEIPEETAEIPAATGMKILFKADLQALSL